MEHRFRELMHSGNEEFVVEALQKDVLTIHECDEAIRIAREAKKFHLIPAFVLKKQGEL